MTSDEIRERFLAFFESRDHRRLRSASLVPTAYDPSTLLISAGMHPLKPYFQGQETPPHNRLTSCQKVFRTVDTAPRPHGARRAASLCVADTETTHSGEVGASRSGELPAKCPLSSVGRALPW